MTATIDKKELVIRIPLQDPTPSASGKTLVVASTRGNVVTSCQVKDQNVIIGLNAYIPAPKGTVGRANVS